MLHMSLVALVHAASGVCCIRCMLHQVPAEVAQLVQSTMTQIAINDEVNFRNVANATLKLARIPGHGCYNRQGRKSISSQEQVQHQNTKNSQHRDQHLPHFTSVNQQDPDTAVLLHERM